MPQGGPASRPPLPLAAMEQGRAAFSGGLMPTTPGPPFFTPPLSQGQALSAQEAQTTPVLAPLPLLGAPPRLFAKLSISLSSCPRRAPPPSQHHDSRCSPSTASISRSHPAKMEQLLQPRSMEGRSDDGTVPPSSIMEAHQAALGPLRPPAEAQLPDTPPSQNDSRAAPTLGWGGGARIPPLQPASSRDTGTPPMGSEERAPPARGHCGPPPGCRQARALSGGAAREGQNGRGAGNAPAHSLGSWPGLKPGSWPEGPRAPAAPSQLSGREEFGCQQRPRSPTGGRQWWRQRAVCLPREDVRGEGGAGRARQGPGGGGGPPARTHLARWP